MCNPLVFFSTLSRALNYDLASPMATKTEVSKLKSKGIEAQGTMNLMVWRRSTISLSILFTLAIAAFQTLDYIASTSQYDSVISHANANITYTADPADSASFRGYSQRVAMSAGAAAMRDVAQVRVYCSLLNIALSLTSAVFLAVSLCCWSYYHKSRQLLMVAWLLSFAVPFGISTVPTRCFVKWDQFELQSHTYMKGVAVHYDLDARETEVVAGCTIITDPSNPQTLEESRHSVESVCDTVDDWDDGFMNWLSGDAIARAKENCRKAQEALNDGNVDLALEYGMETCGEALDTLDSAGAEDGNSLKRMQLVMLHQDLTSKARVGAELGISLLNALWAVKGMVPAAVAIAPALLRGALTIKTLVPQSSIPGMFVILLPWLYCPLVWCIYNVAFQMTGTMIFFFGLLTLAFAPMSYVFLGMIYHITKPMDDHANKKMMNAMSSLNLLLVLISAVLCGYFAFGQAGDHRALAQKGIDEYLKAPVAVTNLVVTTLGKYLVTTLAGVDFMAHEIAVQRDFEVFLETGEDRTTRGYMQSHKNTMGGPDGRFRLLNMLKQKNVRLDDLSHANRKKRKGQGKAQEMVKAEAAKRSGAVQVKGVKQHGSSYKVPVKKQSSYV